MGGNIGPYCFDGDASNALTVSGVRYRKRMKTFLYETNDLDLGNMWFEQDEATCHIARETLTLLF